MLRSLKPPPKSAMKTQVCSEIQICSECKLAAKCNKSLPPHPSIHPSINPSYLNSEQKTAKITVLVSRPIPSYPNILFKRLKPPGKLLRGALEKRGITCTFWKQERPPVSRCVRCVRCEMRDVVYAARCIRARRCAKSDEDETSASNMQRSSILPRKAIQQLALTLPPLNFLLLSLVAALLGLLACKPAM